jgi:hypothetical protein
MFRLSFVINFLDSTVENNQRVADKQVSNVLGKGRINSTFAQKLVTFFVNWHRNIVVNIQDAVGQSNETLVFFRNCTLRDVSTNTVVTAFVDSTLPFRIVVFVWCIRILTPALRRCTTVYTFADDAPTSICIGVDAVNAIIIGAMTASWSYMKRLSSISFAWNVICRQQFPIPNAIASM